MPVILFIGLVVAKALIPSPSVQEVSGQALNIMTLGPVVSLVTNNQVEKEK